MTVIERARAILTTARHGEASGPRPSETPLLNRMRATVRLAGLGALALTAACAAQPSGYGPGYGPAYGMQSGQPQYSGVPGFQDGRNALGTVAGAGVGGLVGNQFGRGAGNTAATIGGVIAGGLIGNALTAPQDQLQTRMQQRISGYRAGRGLTAEDRMLMQEMERRAYYAPLGSTLTYRSPNTGNGASMTPVREGTTARGEFCRDFVINIFQDGRTVRSHAAACQTSRGWRRLAEDERANANMLALAEDEPQAPKMG